MHQEVLNCLQNCLSGTTQFDRYYPFFFAITTDTKKHYSMDFFTYNGLAFPSQADEDLVHPTNASNNGNGANTSGSGHCIIV